MFINNLFKHWTYRIFSPGAVLRKKYEAFRSLLSHDKRAHEVMAELEEIYYNQMRVDFAVIESKYEELSGCVSAIVKDLATVCPARYLDLADYFRKFDFYVRFELAPREPAFSPPFVMLLTQIPAEKRALVGGKAMNLSTISNEVDLPVPKGFVITTNAFFYFIEYNNLWETIKAQLSKTDIQSTVSLEATSDILTGLVLDAEIPPQVQEDIDRILDKIWPKSSADDEIRLAVRSSAVGEDSHSSFAGQYQTLLNVERNQLLQTYKKVLASKYCPEALSYRINFGICDAETPMAVLVLEMVDAQHSGVMYTCDPNAPESNQLSIHAIRGLGEQLVGGRVSPDIITVSKNNHPAVLTKKYGAQDRQVQNTDEAIKENRSTTQPAEHSVCMDDDSSLQLAEWGIQLESYFQEHQDVEWCQDEDGALFVLQSRPLRIENNVITSSQPECRFDDIKNHVLLEGGETACSGIGAGRIYKLHDETALENIPEGAVLVARDASPRYVRVINRLSAVVTDKGSTAGHFSSVAREFGVPTLVDTGAAYASLPDSEDVTVYADGKKVYAGIVQSMMASPCARRNLVADSPFMRRLEYVMSFVAPLQLLNPQAENFKPEGCRSLHDIIRFAHEKAVEEMFTVGNRRVRKIGGSKKLRSDIPMLFYVIDVGGGLRKEQKESKSVTADEITSAPMISLLNGLSHPDIKWGEYTHFDWAEYDKIVMSGGIISPEASMFASHAIVSSNYVNLNLRFGYHFVIVDSICSERKEDNYILFRFSGGGADMEKRMLRASFLGRILRLLQFEVNIKSDLVDGQLRNEDKQKTTDKLDTLGRLLGATRLMDMYLKDHSMVEKYAQEFMNGRYHFATVDD